MEGERQGTAEKEKQEMTYLFYPRDSKEFETELVLRLIAIGAQVRMIQMAERNERAESVSHLLSGLLNPAPHPGSDPTNPSLLVPCRRQCPTKGSIVHPAIRTLQLGQAGDEKGES